MRSARHKYNNDPKYKNAVEALLYLLENSILTTEDIASATVLAAQIYAERHSTPTMIFLKTKEEEQE